MLIINLRNKLRLSVFVFIVGLVISTTTFADRFGDGAVKVEIKNNNLCFSVDKYKPRGYFFKSLKIGPQGFDVHRINISKFQHGVAIWGQSQPIKQNVSAFNLKPDQCIKYGMLINNYVSQGNSLQRLESGRFTVIISGYDPANNNMTTLMSVFSLDVTNGKVTLK